MMKVIEIENLSKSFGEVKAVENLSFSVNKGELFAFLGLNGAGKSTTISIICGQLAKDAGKVFVNGEDLDRSIDKIKRELGVVFQNSALDKTLSVKDNLESRAALYGIRGEQFKNRLDELAKLLEFEGLLKRTFGKLSGGEKRRIDIARALLHKPKILILDEPTTGLDPQTRKLVWSVIKKLRETEEITVFLTTHYMEEATDADYVVILNHGKIAAEGTVQQLKNEYTGDFITIYNLDEAQVKQLGKPYEKVASAYRLEVANCAEATRLIAENPQLFTDYELTKGKMDDVFLAVTGEKLTGGEENE
ncbi:MAG: ABC transporter ATP-binding protein [Ruminococcus sp.]|nr:ABC transporter ATP-binding protein [Ruminococcus sp.]